MRIRLTIAAVLAVFAISAPLASAESTGVPGAVEGTVMIEHITESGTIVLITVSQNACQEHESHLLDSARCGGDALAPAPPVELIVGPPEGAGPPIGLDPGRPEDVGPPCDPADRKFCVGL